MVVNVAQTGGLANLNDKEMGAFTRWWGSFKYYWATDGKFQLFSEKPHRDWALKAVREYKARTNLNFRGGNAHRSGTFGIRAIQVEDVISTTTTEWDITWGTTGLRNWLGFEAADGTTFPHTQIRLRDTSDRIWYVLIWGILDLDPSPAKITRILIDLSADPMATRYIERDIRFNELRVSWFSEQIYIQEQPFRVGVDVVEAGSAVLMPLGVTITEYERMKDQTVVGPSRPNTA